MRWAVIVVVLLGGAFLWHLRGGLGTREAPGSVESVVARAMRSLSIPGRYNSMRNPVSCSDEDLKEAREHWADHCATCHANDGSGNSLLGKTMYPRPEIRQKLSDGELYYVIKNGVRLTGMPAFGEPGDDDTGSWRLVCFIRHLPKMTAEEEIAMRALNPKTPADLDEERREQEFLNGGAEPKHQPGAEHVHH